MGFKRSRRCGRGCGCGCGSRSTRSHGRLVGRVVSSCRPGLRAWGPGRRHFPTSRDRTVFTSDKGAPEPPSVLSSYSSHLPVPPTLGAFSDGDALALSSRRKTRAKSSNAGRHGPGKLLICAPHGHTRVFCSPPSITRYVADSISTANRWNSSPSGNSKPSSCRTAPK